MPDLIVAGGGVLGLATAYAAARRGASVVVLEKRAFGHDETASGGTSRQFRIQYDDPALARLVLASRPLWSRLQADADEELLTRTGCLWFGDLRDGRIEVTLGVLTALGIPFDRLTAAEVQSRYGFAEIPPGWSGFVQPHGAAVNVKATLRAFHTVIEILHAVQVMQIPRQ